MSIQRYGRCGVVLGVVALVSACSIGSGRSDRSSECRWIPSRCGYEGVYEPGEDAYAEEEAKRLNKAASKRVRRR